MVAYCWWELKVACSCTEPFLKKLKMELPYDPANPHLGIDPKAIAPLSQGVTFTPMLFTALFKIPKIAKQLE